MIPPNMTASRGSCSRDPRPELGPSQGVWAYYLSRQRHAGLPRIRKHGPHRLQFLAVTGDGSLVFAFPIAQEAEKGD